ncbi:ribose 5-phosphate isomerase A-domain-containing protein [Microdochium bolleyi]|uniref:Ribose-5-phosphate isomerase n=1 Tax=Microdochium bolleyi TaxID=196109 RepID=A0A136JDM5_9PEZI|nr:ribose 5-phosphate isomerase A-domain-containing protein [Microdochium bolleyi]
MSPSTTKALFNCTKIGRTFGVVRPSIPAARNFATRRVQPGAVITQVPTRASLLSPSFISPLYHSSLCTSARTMAPTDNLVEPPVPTPVNTAGDLVEAAKRAAGRRAVEDYLSPEFRYVGIGSGSTIKYVVEAIADLPRDVTAKMKFVPTGSQSRALIREAKLTVLAIDDLVLEFNERVPGQQYLDVCFDGADEVDPELNCIKGGGACHYQEKLVAKFSKQFVCVADYRKEVPNLLTSWVGIPIEVQPLATEAVRRELLLLGSKKPFVRSGLPGKAGSIVTDNGNNVIDAPFPPLLLNSQADQMDPSKGLWTVDALASRIKAITGVLEVGVFSGHTGPEALQKGMGGEKPVKVYFGMKDGSVKTLG